MITAKPVVPDQYWILRDQDTKIGNIEIQDGEYVVSINGQRRTFASLNKLKDTITMKFEEDHARTTLNDARQAHGFPTTAKAYNVVYDVQHRIPLWTSDPRSRSWMAAGWYRVKQRRNWQIMQCPKLILLQRYAYQGPFHSREEAMKS